MSSNPSIKWDAPKCAPYVKRVCRAWHEARRVPVPTPGVRRAEGKEKGQGVVARRGLRRANGAVPAASSIAVADHLAGQVGDHQWHGQQQESEEGERARDRRERTGRAFLSLNQVVGDRTRP